MINKTCLSYWFPKLEAAGLPVPKTRWLRTELDLIPLCDGLTPAGFPALATDIERMAGEVGGFPCFLRTGHTSGKHQWKSTCYLARPIEIGSHVAALVEFSAMADIMGLPSNVWVVRELLPVEPLAVLGNYGDMPLVKEARGFIRDGKVKCVHPYWPTASVAQGIRYQSDDPWNEETPAAVAQQGKVLAERASTISLNEAFELMDLLHRVAAVFDGYWSVDVLWTKRGLYVTDMAEGEISFHWPECPKVEPRKESTP